MDPNHGSDASIDHARAAHCALVNAAHQFLVAFLPLRNPESYAAVDAFVKVIHAAPVPRADVDTILLRCLITLDRRIGRPTSTLVHRYTDPSRQAAGCVRRFQLAIEELFKSSGTRHPLVNRVIRILGQEYSDPKLRQSAVAARVGATPSALSVAFKTETGVTFKQYLSRKRLEQAGVLLANGWPRIKDVWVAVGYNHASNFDHDFKRHFGVPPTEYRTRRNDPSTPCQLCPLECSSPQAEAATGARPDVSVLLIDDDRGTRVSIGKYLRLQGYTVATAETGTEGLRQAARLSPRVVLLDYHLPDIDGIQCLQALRRLSNSADSRVVMFTADVLVYEQEDTIHSLGATILPKLCDLEDIGELVRGISSRAASESR